MKPGRFAYWLWVSSLVFAMGMPDLCRCAETIFSPSTQTNSLDNVDLLARPAALGGAFTGVADDASALFSNPAGLAFLGQGQVLLNSNFWLVGVFQETLLLGLPVKSLGGFAFSANYLDYGSFEGRDNFGSLTNSYEANRVSLSIGGGFTLLPNLAFGLGLEGSQSDLAGVGYGRFSGSLGVLWRNPKGFRLGLSYLNAGLLSPGGSSADTVNLGGSYQARLNKSDGLLVALGASLEPNGFQYLQAGAEVTLQNQLFLRVGYQQGLEDNALEGLTGLTAGVGLQLSGWSFDYAYLPYGNLGAAHRVTLGYFFANNEPPASKPSLKPQSIPTAPPLAVSPNQGHPLKQTAPLPPIGTPLPGLEGLPGMATPTPSPSQKATPGQKHSTKLVPPPPDEKESLDMGSVTLGPDPSKPKDSLVIQFDLPDNAPTTAGPSNTPDPTLRDLQAQRDLVQKNPLDASAWMALGNIYWKLHQKAYAIQCFEQVLKLEPNDQKLADWLAETKASQPLEGSKQP